jgi:hypothetical protein
MKAFNKLRLPSREQNDAVCDHRWWRGAAQRAIIYVNIAGLKIF